MKDLRPAAILLIIFCIVAAALVLRRCKPKPTGATEEPKTGLNVVQTRTDTVYITLTKMVVERVPGKPSKSIPGAPVYIRKDSTIYVEISADSSKAVIDSLSIADKQTIEFTQLKGKAKVHVLHTSPYISDTEPEYFKLSEIPRLGFGPYIGAGIATNGRLYPTVGVGVFFNLAKRN